MSTFTGNLEWRNATKGFDSARKVDAAAFAKIKAAIRMAPTSFGLQPFQVEVIESAELKAKIAPLAWNQPQITTCSHLLVFCARRNATARIDQYFTERSGGNADARAKFKDYEGMMNGSLGPRTPEQLQVWAAKQAYLALGFALAACAELQIDSCPMEGFSGPDLDKLLGFDADTTSHAILTIGYRDPAIAPMPKFRFAESDLIRSR
jgi:nitroreductase / dihydropteridine reductase